MLSLGLDFCQLELSNTERKCIRTDQQGQGVLTDCIHLVHLVTGQTQPWPSTGWSYLRYGFYNHDGEDMTRTCSEREGRPGAIRFLAHSSQHFYIRKLFLRKSTHWEKLQTLKTSLVGAQIIMYISNFIMSVPQELLFINHCWSGSVNQSWFLPNICKAWYFFRDVYLLNMAVKTRPLGNTQN